MQSSNTINSITILHEMLGCKKPNHPLVTCISLEEVKHFDKRFISDFFIMVLEKNVDRDTEFIKNVYIYEPEANIDMIRFVKSEGMILFISYEFVNENHHNLSILSNKDYNNIIPIYSRKQSMNIIILIEKLQVEVSQNLDIYSNDLIKTIVKNLLLLLIRQEGLDSKKMDK